MHISPYSRKLSWVIPLHSLLPRKFYPQIFVRTCTQCGVASAIRESFISELLYFIQFGKVSRYTVYFHTLCLLSQSHTHYLAGSLTHSSATHSLTHSLTLSLTPSPTHPLTHSQVRDVVLSSTSVGARHRDHLLKLWQELSYKTD